MQLDAQMLDSLEADAILHFYEWERESLTYGYFADPAKLLDLKRVQAEGIDLARRPTGGGVVFHLWDLAFSVLIPSTSPYFSLNTLDNYAFINNAVLKAVEQFLGGKESFKLTPEDGVALDESCNSFCMAKPTKYDLVLGGRKLAGAAQRKRKQGFLHQGTIALIMPPEPLLRSLLLPEAKVAEAILAHTYPLLGQEATPSQMAQAKKELRQFLENSLKTC